MIYLFVLMVIFHSNVKLPKDVYVYAYIIYIYIPVPEF